MILPEIGYTPRNLRVLMDIRQITNDKVAELLDVDIRTVSRWRSGKATMPHKQWVLLLVISDFNES